MRKSKRVAIFAVATMAALLTVATPAYAVSNTCTLGTFATSCTSGITPNNPGGHWVDLHIHNYTTNQIHYQVVDVDTGKWVADGTLTNGNGLDRTITGLYGRYRLKMQKQILGAGAQGVLENELP